LLAFDTGDILIIRSSTNQITVLEVTDTFWCRLKWRWMSMVESRVRKSTIVVLCSTMTTTRIVHCEVEATVCLKSSYLIIQVDIGPTHAQVELLSPEWLRKEKGREHTTTFQITERGGAKRPKSYMMVFDI